MSDNNQTKIITVAEKTAKEYADNTDYVFKDQNGMIFHVYQFKKGTKTESEAYKQMLNMEIKVGSTVEAWYAEVPNKHGTNTRYIASFREATARPVQTPISPQKAPVKSNLSEPAYVSEQKDEKFWDKKAYKQCLWNYWLEFRANKGKEWMMTNEEYQIVWETFNQIEKDADKRFAQGWDKAVKTFATEDAPLPEDPGEVDVQGIPF